MKQDPGSNVVVDTDVVDVSSSSSSTEKPLMSWSSSVGAVGVELFCVVVVVAVVVAAVVSTVGHGLLSTIVVEELVIVVPMVVDGAVVSSLVVGDMQLLTH